MSYKRIDAIPRAERTLWSKERGGRNWQMVGGHKVKKFAFSPYTAKAKQAYTFYADVVLKVGIESPPGSGKQRRDITIIAHVGTFIEFRDMVASGEIPQRIVDIVAAMGGGEIESVAYWRNNKAERVGDDDGD